jgi:hypothetical protein
MMKNNSNPVKGRRWSHHVVAEGTVKGLVNLPSYAVQYGVNRWYVPRYSAAP